MNKQAYLSELEGLLTEKRVTDVDEIIAEYDEHFSRKLADGFSEEEIAKRLGGPKEVAAQFATEKTGGRSRGAKAILTAGLVFVDIVVILLLVVFYAWVAALGATAVASALGGIALLLEPALSGWAALIPDMPYFGQIFFAVAMLGLGVLFWPAHPRHTSCNRCPEMRSRDRHGIARSICRSCSHAHPVPMPGFALSADLQDR